MAKKGWKWPPELTAVLIAGASAFLAAIADALIQHYVNKQGGTPQKSSPKNDPPTV